MSLEGLGIFFLCIVGWFSCDNDMLQFESGMVKRSL